MYKAADAVLKDDNEMEKAKTLALDRADACSVIVQFLTSLKGGLRSAVSGYIRCDHCIECYIVLTILLCPFSEK